MPQDYEQFSALLEGWKVAFAGNDFCLSRAEESEKLLADFGIGLIGHSCGVGRYRLEFPQIGDAFIDFDEKVIRFLTMNADVSGESVWHAIADQVIPRIIAHQRKLVFHAGAVEIDNAAILFLGPSGMGKSTLVSSFLEDGAKLLGDDAIILCPGEVGVNAEAVYPSLRLFPEILEHVRPDYTELLQVAHYSDKVRVIPTPSQSCREGAIPLRAMFFIAPTAGRGAIAVRRIAQSKICMGLIEQSFALDPNSKDLAISRFAGAALVAECIPGFELQYPRDLALLPEVRAAVLNQLDKLLRF